MPIWVSPPTYPTTPYPINPPLTISVAGFFVALAPPALMCAGPLIRLSRPQSILYPQNVLNPCVKPCGMNAGCAQIVAGVLIAPEWRNGQRTARAMMRYALTGASERGMTMTQETNADVHLR